jgi:hypothetical protein
MREEFFHGGDNVEMLGTNEKDKGELNARARIRLDLKIEGVDGERKSAVLFLLTL